MSDEVAECFETNFAGDVHPGRWAQAAAVVSLFDGLVTAGKTTSTGHGPGGTIYILRYSKEGQDEVLSWSIDIGRVSDIAHNATGCRSSMAVADRH